jgi:hypothetical protein
MTTENYTDVKVYLDKFSNGEVIEYYGVRRYPCAPIRVWYQATFIGKWSIDQVVVKVKYDDEPKIVHHSDIRKLT